MKKILIIATSGIFILIACSKSSDTSRQGGGTTLDCSAVTVKAFAADVSPIIQSKCATDSDCHGSGSTSGPGALTNYTAIFNARSITRSSVASGAMPKTGSITTAQKNSILCWIDSGAQNN
jgi:uncharacterized membrane protein